MIDVSDILDDPDFQRPLILTRTTISVDDNGESSQTATEETIMGVILPVTDEQLERLAEADRSSEAVAVYTTKQLTAGTDTLAPDEITWRSITYRVRQIKDRLDQGGYVMALAVSISLHGREIGE